MVFDYVGIDVSKSKLDIYWNEQYWQVGQTENEINTFIEKVRSLLEKENQVPLFVNLLEDMKDCSLRFSWSKGLSTILPMQIKLGILLELNESTYTVAR